MPGLEPRSRGDSAARSLAEGEQPPADNPPAAQPQRGIAENMMVWGTNALLGGWAASAAYRLAQNPQDFVNAPAHAIGGVLAFNERLSTQDLQAARQMVLDHYGPYIRPDSRCHDVEPQLAFEIGNAAGAYHSNPRGTGPMLFVAPYQRAGAGAHSVAHELVHCYTHPGIYDKLIETDAGRQMLDSVTEYLADKLPGTWFGQFTQYDRTTMSNGRNMVGAAAALELAVGEETLLNAMFGGNERAVTAVSRAAVALYPKKATLAAWGAIAKAGKKQGAHEMAEAFVAASLVHESQLPADSDSRIWPGAYLPLRSFSDITRPQQKALRTQAMAMRERVGPEAFDQAFCNFDDRAALVSLRAIRADLIENWARVL